MRLPTPDKTSACSSTVCVAFSCLSGGTRTCAIYAHAQLSLDVVANRPVDGDVLAHRGDELSRDVLQRLVAQNLNRAVIGLQGVVERHLVVRQAQLFTPGAGRAHVLRKLDQLFDQLGGLDRAVLVLAESPPELEFRPAVD